MSGGDILLLVFMVLLLALNGTLAMINLASGNPMIIVNLIGVMFCIFTIMTILS